MKFFRKFHKELLFASTIIMTFIVIAAMFILAEKIVDGAKANAESKIVLQSDNIQTVLDKKLSELSSDTVNIASAASRYATFEEFKNYLSSIEESDEGKISFIRYFKNDVEYSAVTGVIEGESERILSLVEAGVAAHTDVIYYSIDKKGVGFFVPMPSTTFADSLFIFYQVNQIATYKSDVKTVYVETADAVCFCNVNGEIFEVIAGETATEEKSIFKLTEDLNPGEGLGDSVKQCFEENEDGVFSFYKNGQLYYVSVTASDKSFGLFNVSFYNANAVYSYGSEIANMMYSLMFVVVLILVFVCFYYVATSQRANKRIVEEQTMDKLLGCYRLPKFELESDDIIERHKGTKYAFVLAKVEYFRYIIDNFGSEISDKVLKLINRIYLGSLQDEEIYGYIADSRFVMLLHYKDKDTLSSRLKVINRMIEKSLSGVMSKLNVKIGFIVYEIDSSVPINSRNSVDKALSFERISSEDKKYTLIRYYSDMTDDKYKQDADITMKMEEGLKNDEFQVFYQPKYDLINNHIEGSEALVRWYNPKSNEYRAPDTFLPLFEENGFIEKIDRLVYLKVCEFIYENSQAKKTSYPVSVNVSRFTAMSKTFIDYYVSIKKKYKIPDNFITVEFTESFAYENYDILNEVTEKLQANGFLCSIDDFGSGYSSYEILKNLAVNEIKLDRFFIHRGMSEERDKLILSSTIKMLRDIGVKIVQEGVENLDDAQMLKEMGCSVIQGYYYSKPLILSDYIKFTENAKVIGFKPRPKK